MGREIILMISVFTIVNLLLCTSSDYVKAQNNIKSSDLGLIAHFTFDGDVNDISGNNNHGKEIFGNVRFEQGVNGKSIKFGGFHNPGHIRIKNNASLNFENQLSLSLWATIDSYDGMDGNGNLISDVGGGCLIAKSHDRIGFVLKIYALKNGEVHLGFSNNYFRNDSLNLTSKILDNYNLGSWFHIAIIVDKGLGEIYLNGNSVKKFEHIKVNFDDANSRDLILGKFEDKWYPFNGKIDELRIYNRELSRLEVSDLFLKNNNVSLKNENLYGLWKGQWTNELGYIYDCILKLSFDHNNKLQGEFKWEFIKSPDPNDLSKIGLKAIEFSEGSFDAKTFKVNLTGIRKEDQYNIIGLDEYELTYNPVEFSLNGKTRNHGNWKGKFYSKKLILNAINQKFAEAQKAFEEKNYIFVVESLKDFPIDDPLYSDAVILMNKAVSFLVSNTNQNFATVSGRISNKKNKKISGSIIFQDYYSNTEIGRCRIIDDGYYCIVLPSGKYYTYYIDAQGFYPISRTINFSSSTVLPNHKDDVELVSYEEMEVEQLAIRINNIFFDFNESVLKPESFPELDRLYEVLKNNPNFSIELSGHTDAIGTDEYNLSLSQRRADAVTNYLVSKGISTGRIISKGYGKRNPVATNDTEEGRQLNRRVEFKILKK